jgi:hypothetical protein
VMPTKNASPTKSQKDKGAGLNEDPHLNSLNPY